MTDIKDKKSRKKKVNPKVEWIFDCLSPKPDKYLQELADRLVLWASDDEDAIVLTEFMGKNRIAPKVFYQWCNRYEPLLEALNFAKIMIGTRREKMGLQRKLDSAFVEKTMPLYNTEYKAWRLELMQKVGENQKPTEIKVIMQQFPSTPDVPERKSDN